MPQITAIETPFENLLAVPPTPLSFAPDVHVRAFLLRRDAGNLLIYNAPGIAAAAPELEAAGGVARHYLNHSHEAMFGPQGVDAPLFAHELDRPAIDMALRGTFSRRHMIDGDFEVIPTPGHTPGATAFLWSGFLFTGDTLYLRDGEWRAGVLDSSDRAAYADSLTLMAELDFDVLVPWAATAGEPYFAATTRDDARRRLDAIISGLR